MVHTGVYANKKDIDMVTELVNQQAGEPVIMEAEKFLQELARKYGLPKLEHTEYGLSDVGEFII